MLKTYPCLIEAPIVQLRFAYSGKLVYVKKKKGDQVKQWEAIASLDKKILQAELDRQLADYEKVRAQFEIFTLKNGQEGGDDITKFLRQEKQSALNASVKDVEIAKHKLDQADLISPIEGVVINMNGLVPGLNITPASSAVDILVTNAFYATFDISQKDLDQFTSTKDVIVSFPEPKKEYKGTTTIPLIGKNDQFSITVILNDAADLIYGMKGKVTINN